MNTDLSLAPIENLVKELQSRCEASIISLYGLLEDEAEFGNEKSTYQHLFHGGGFLCIGLARAIEKYIHEQVEISEEL